MLADQRPVNFAQSQDAPRGLGSLRAHLNHAAQGEGEPTLPVSMVARGLPARVVVLPVTLEEV
jgi:hypothetical protein